MPDFNLLSDPYQSRARMASAQSLVNLYPELQTDSAVVLYGTPGLSTVATMTDSGCRGMVVANDLLFAVFGPTVYQIDTNIVPYTIGTIGTSSGPVSMASNGTQIMLLDGTATGYIITISARTIAAIADTDFPGGADVAFSSGVFLFREPDSGRFWATDSYNGASLDGLSFATTESSPDNLNGLLTDHGEVWLAGTGSIEVWHNTGSSDFPFSLIPGAIIETGCAAGQSMRKVDNSIFWLGQDSRGQGTVWRANGYTPERVSTHAVEFAISNYSRIDDAVAWTYQQDGHLFYVLTFPTADATWVYDVATQRWHQRSWMQPNDGTLHRHRGAAHAWFAGRHLVGDHTSGALYEMDMDIYSDDGDAIRREIVTPHLRNQKDRMFYHDLEVRMETGVGLVSGQGSYPQISLECSNDGGRTWGNARPVSFGAMGEYQTRARWAALGSTLAGRTFRLRITDPVPVCIVDARLTFS